jgi:hypothetical protein
MRQFSFKDKHRLSLYSKGRSNQKKKQNKRHKDKWKLTNDHTKNEKLGVLEMEAIYT